MNAASRTARLCTVLTLLACVAAAAPAVAQDRLPPGVRAGPPGGGMATRSVSKFLGLERALQEALAQRDRNAVAQLLAEDFEVRTAASPDAAGADEWLRRELTLPSRERIVRDLAVREFDDLAVVSFLLEPASVRQAGGATWFVVDVWRQSTGKLHARYIERPVNPPARQSRPSGRE
jgi:hypothetical protein